CGRADGRGNPGARSLPGGLAALRPGNDRGFFASFHRGCSARFVRGPGTKLGLLFAPKHTRTDWPARFGSPPAGRSFGQSHRHERAARSRHSPGTRWGSHRCRLRPSFLAGRKTGHPANGAKSSRTRGQSGAREEIFALRAFCSRLFGPKHFPKLLPGKTLQNPFGIVIWTEPFFPKMV